MGNVMNGARANSAPDTHCRITRWRPKKYSRYRIRNAFADTTAKLLSELGRAK